MKDRLKSFFIKQKPFIALFMGFVLLAASVAIGLRADATPMPTQTLSGTITSSQTLSPSYVYIVSPDVAIASGATLTIPAGTIVKFQSGPITVRQGGSLRVTGTAASPVHFTSIKDDTVGGDTNGDGNATAPAMDDYQRAVATEDGDVNIVFAKFNYFARAVEGSRTTGSIVVTDSTFNNGHVAIAVGGPTVKLYRNTFGNLEPYSLDGAVQVSSIQDLTKVSLSGIDQNVFTGTAKFSRIIRITQAVLPAGKTWSPASSSGAIVYFQNKNEIKGTANFGTKTSYVLSGGETLSVTGSLNIQSGVWVKYNWDGFIQASGGGTVNITGTSTDKVYLTSLKNDTVGGDTNGDGTVSSPASGDYARAIGSSASTINMSYTNLSYASTLVEGDFIGLTITDSKFTNSNQAIHSSGTQTLLLERNEISVSPNQYTYAAIYLNSSDLSGISLSGVNKNEFFGSAYGRSIRVENSAVPANKTMNIGPDSNVIFSPYGHNLNIYGTLNLNQNAQMAVYGTPSWMSSIYIYGVMNVNAGAIVKYADTQGISVETGGSLNINGTSTNKVKMTSLADDTIGGDTNMNGNYSSPMPYDFDGAVRLNGGNLYAIFAHINYAKSAIDGPANSLKVFDSKFENTAAAISADVPNVKIYRNEFKLLPASYTRGAIQLKGVQDISRVGFTGSDRNYFTGPYGPARIVQFYKSTLPAGASMTVAETDGAILRMLGHENDIRGNLTIAQDSTLLMEDGLAWRPTLNIYGKLKIEQGARIKLQDTSGIDVKDGAQLDINGTVDNEINATHYFDDTVGGDTNGDGTYNLPSSGGYNFLTLQTGSQVKIHSLKLAYAYSVISQVGGNLEVTGLQSKDQISFMYVGGGEANLTGVKVLGSRNIAVLVDHGNVVFRGTFEDLQSYAVKACKWGNSSCAMDAAYVEWGNTGPTANIVCGQVTVWPWTNDGVVVMDGHSLFTSRDCDGSPTPDEQLSTAASYYTARAGQKTMDCSNGFEDACQAIVTAQTCLEGAKTVASSYSSFPLPDGNAYEQPAQWAGMLANNAADYIENIEGPVPKLRAGLIALEIISVATTSFHMINAYNACAP